ncbi:hypothetical protein M9458_037062, partial [Cirrhinus mrigala]
CAQPAAHNPSRLLSRRYTQPARRPALLDRGLCSGRHGANSAGLHRHVLVEEPSAE